MNKFEIRFYANRRGDSLVEEFVLSQGEDVIAKFNRIADLLKLKGPDLGMPLSRNLGHNLYELRIRGKNEVRIFYVAVYNPSTIILLHAFKKRTQKIPDREIKIARNRQKELT